MFDLYLLRQRISVLKYGDTFGKENMKKKKNNALIVVFILLLLFLGSRNWLNNLNPPHCSLPCLKVIFLRYF